MNSYIRRTKTPVQRLFAICGLTCCLVTFPAMGHVRGVTPSGVPLVLADPEHAGFLVNEDIGPGLRNSDGQVMIAENSDPLGAIAAAAKTWNEAGSRLHVLPFSPTVLSGNPGDGINVIFLKDTPEVRSVVGGALAVTAVVYNRITGAIVDSDIYLAPVLPENLSFGTQGAPETFDLQSIITHEMGHAFGAQHSPLPTATMFFTYVSLFSRTLSADDVSFARYVYPNFAISDPNGAISGFITLPTGSPGRGVMVTAVDPSTGVTVGTVSSVRDGTYFLNAVPPGKYLVYAEPLDLPASPSNFQFSSIQVDLNFETTFYGSANTLVEVNPAKGVNANIELAPKVGTLKLDSFYALARGRQGGLGDLFENQPALELRSGESLDLLFGGPGFDATITESSVRLLGPGITIRPGSLLVEPLLVFGDGSQIMRMTVDVTEVAQRSVISLMVQRGDDIVVRTAAYVIPPAIPLIFSSSRVQNAATLTAGPVTPNSWVSIFGDKLAAELVVGGEPLANTLGGTRVEVVDRLGRARVASLQFVSPGQLNFLMPSGLATGTAQVQVYGLLGQGTTTVDLQTVAPGIFTAGATGRGPAAATFLNIAPDSVRTFGYTFDVNRELRPNVPVGLGPEGTQVYLMFYGTGLRSHSRMVKAQVGGLDVPVSAAVAQGTYAGLDQINIGPLPRDLAGRGEMDVLFNVDGQLTNLVTVNIQ